jgi:hypothetical protein
MPQGDSKIDSGRRPPRSFKPVEVGRRAHCLRSTSGDTGKQEEFNASCFKQVSHPARGTMGVENKPPTGGADLTNRMHDLSQRAEAALRQRALQSPEQLAALSSVAAQGLLHELHVHHIELEMQHEELHRIHGELDASHARYVDLFDLAPVGYCTVPKAGLISEVTCRNC